MAQMLDKLKEFKSKYLPIKNWFFPNRFDRGSLIYKHMAGLLPAIIFTGLWYLLDPFQEAPLLFSINLLFIAGFIVFWLIRKKGLALISLTSSLIFIISVVYLSDAVIIQTKNSYAIKRHGQNIVVELSDRKIYRWVASLAHSSEKIFFSHECKGQQVLVLPRIKTTIFEPDHTLGKSTRFVRRFPTIDLQSIRLEIAVNLRDIANQDPEYSNSLDFKLQFDVANGVRGVNNIIPALPDCTFEKMSLTPAIEYIHYPRFYTDDFFEYVLFARRFRQLAAEGQGYKLTRHVLSAPPIDEYNDYLSMIRSRLLLITLEDGVFSIWKKQYQALLCNRLVHAKGIKGPAFEGLRSYICQGKTPTNGYLFNRRLTSLLVVTKITGTQSVLDNCHNLGGRIYQGHCIRVRAQGPAYHGRGRAKKILPHSRQVLAQSLPSRKLKLRDGRVINLDAAQGSCPRLANSIEVKKYYRDYLQVLAATDIGKNRKRVCTNKDPVFELLSVGRKTEKALKCFVSNGGNLSAWHRWISIRLKDQCVNPLTDLSARSFYDEEGFKNIHYLISNMHDVFGRSIHSQMVDALRLAGIKQVLQCFKFGLQCDEADEIIKSLNVPRFKKFFDKLRSVDFDRIVRSPHALAKQFDNIFFDMLLCLASRIKEVKALNAEKLSEVCERLGLAELPELAERRRVETWLAPEM